MRPVTAWLVTCLQGVLKPAAAAVAAAAVDGAGDDVAGKQQVRRRTRRGTAPDNATDRRPPAVHSPSSLHTQTHHQFQGCQTVIFRGYSIIGSGSGFTLNLGSDSLGKLNDFRRI